MRFSGGASGASARSPTGNKFLRVITSVHVNAREAMNEHCKRGVRRVLFFCLQR